MLEILIPRKIRIWIVTPSYVISPELKEKGGGYKLLNTRNNVQGGNRQNEGKLFFFLILKFNILCFHQQKYSALPLPLHVVNSVPIFNFFYFTKSSKT